MIIGAHKMCGFHTNNKRPINKKLGDFEQIVGGFNQ